MGSGASRCNVSFIVEETVFVHHNVLNGRNFRSRGGRPGLPVPNSLYSLCGRKATLKELQLSELRGCVNYDVIRAGKGLTCLMGDGPS